MSDGTVSPDAPVTYREFDDFMRRVDARNEKLDTQKADTKDVDVVANMVRELRAEITDIRRDVAAEVSGLRRVLVGFMVTLAIAAIGYAASTYQLTRGDQPNVERTK